VFGEATALTGEAAAKAMTKNSLLRFIPNILKKDDKWLELLIIMLDKAGSHAEIITTLIPSPKKPELGALYYLRHAFGPLNPSYYVQLFTAIGTGDYELWMFGTGALAYRDKKRIRDQFAEEERRVLRTIGMIDLQLSCHYYRNAALIALPL
jgi:hypothetical protein